MLDLKHAEFFKISNVSGSSKSPYYDFSEVQDAGERLIKIRDSLSLTMNLTSIIPLVHLTAPTLTHLEINVAPYKPENKTPN